MSVRIFSGTRRVDSIAPDDRGLAYGDGLFETMRVHRGDIPWWSVHWTRLAAGAERLRLPLPEPGLVRAQAAALFADEGDGVLKLLVTRGAGARGYAPLCEAVPTWIVSRHVLPPDRPSLHLHWCETRLAIQPVLAGIKHCNRLEQVLARAECEHAGADEGLMRDGDGHVVGATAANLFALLDGRWRTPALDRCGVAGICRSHLLPALHATEARLTVPDIEASEAVFLCNAVRGILVVDRLGNRRWPFHPAIVAVRRELAALHPGFASDLENK